MMNRDVIFSDFVIVKACMAHVYRMFQIGFCTIFLPLSGCEKRKFAVLKMK